MGEAGQNTTICDWALQCSSASNRLLCREIDYLEESKLLKARASQLMTHPIIGSLHHELVHIAITDENYVSGKETGLGRIPRRQLRQAALQRSFEDL